MPSFKIISTTVALIALLLCSTAVSQPLERGVKAGNMEDVILVGGTDWHNVVAATPLAMGQQDDDATQKPMMILPRKVQAGDRIGWLEQSDIERYGVRAILHSLTSVGISAVVINGTGDIVKEAVDVAKKEGIAAYVTVTLRAAGSDGQQITTVQSLIEEGFRQGRSPNLMVDDLWSIPSPTAEAAVQVERPQQDGLARTASGSLGDLFCPVDPDVREGLFNQVEQLIDEYEVSGVILYEFGFQDEGFCFCDVCKEEFYKDTGLELTKVGTSSYNYQKWQAWREQKVLDLAREVRNITSDLGPVRMGVAIRSPLDRSQGYNFEKLAEVSDLTIINPIQAGDMSLAAKITSTPVYVRLSDDYVEYTISTQNVEGTVKYIEDLVSRGGAGMAFEYDVTHSPLWSELEPPSPSMAWTIGMLGGSTLGIGEVYWNCTNGIRANNSTEMADQISRRWASSPGAVLCPENYTAGLQAASIGAYLNWPVLFTAGGDVLPNETISALNRLGATQVVLAGPVSPNIRADLKQRNLTLMDGGMEFLLEEMAGRNETVESIVVTNSQDLSLIPPRPERESKRALAGGVLLSVELSPSRIPSDEAGQIVRMNITVTNHKDEAAKEVSLADTFYNGRMVRLPSSYKGQARLIDPSSSRLISRDGAFWNGTLLIWEIDELQPGESASLPLEVEMLHPMDAGWKQSLDYGMTISHSLLKFNVSARVEDSWPITNITFPKEMPMGVANITWNVDGIPRYTALRVLAPDGRMGQAIVDVTAPGKTYRAKVPMIVPGSWKFQVESGNGYIHTTDNYTINVTSTLRPANITAFGHTMVPRLSQVASQMAAGRKGLVYDIAEAPQSLEPAELETRLKERAEALGLKPKYIIVVGDPGSVPFVSTGTKQNETDILGFDVYRELRLEMDDDNFTEVAAGRIMGLSLYDASQMVVRSLSYDRLDGAWKNQTLVVTNPVEWPWTPIPLRVQEYLADAGLDSRDLRWEETTSQKVASLMNNGLSMVFFSHHGNEAVWQLSYWSLPDSYLEATQVKQLVLAPQVTSSQACLSARLKGQTVRVGNTDMYVPMELEDSIAMAFIHAGAVDYIGYSILSWIFVSEDYSKRFFQSLVYENATIGQAMLKAEQLYQMKMDAAKGMVDYKDLDEQMIVDFPYSMEEMFNQTATTHVLIGDPALRPYMPRTPKLPYSISTEPAGENRTEEQVTISPQKEASTDWLYWVQTEAADGKLMLNAPPAIIGQVELPVDADQITVKENGRAVWHDEDVFGSSRLVLWPVVRPRLGENRTFVVEYKLIPGLIQTINITSGWNSVSLYLSPTDPSVSRYFKDKPYRGIFTAASDGWTYSLRDLGLTNVTSLEAGAGYLVDSAENFTVKIKGKPVESPYRLKLHQGWNLVGLPMNASLTAENITVNSEHRRYQFSEAVEKGLVSAFIWKLDPDGGWVHLGQNESLIPGQAYLVEVLKECRLEFRTEGAELDG